MIISGPKMTNLGESQQSKTPLSSRSDSFGSSFSLKDVKNNKDNFLEPEENTSSSRNPDSIINISNSLVKKQGKRPQKRSRCIGTLISSCLTSNNSKKKTAKHHQKVIFLFMFIYLPRLSLRALMNEPHAIY